LVAATVRVEELPWVIVAGLAAIVTEALLPPAAGAAVPVPHEVMDNREMSPTQMNEAEHEKVRGSFGVIITNRVPSMLPESPEISLEIPGSQVEVPRST
jgi:hypothetical protein